MNRNQHAALAALKSLPLGNLTEQPVVKLALRYWWLSLPVGVALYGKYKARMEEQDRYKIYNAFDDFGTIMGPVMTFVGLSELANRMDRSGTLRDAPAVRDADYTPVESQPAQEQQL